MNRRITRLLLVLLIASFATSGCFWRKKKKKGPPPPPPVVTLRADATLREASEVKSPAVAALAKGSRLAVTKMRGDWVAVTTTDGKSGFVQRATIGRRTLVIGTGGFPYTRTVGDRLRRVPILDVVRIEDTGRMMPSTPAGGVDGARQLDGGVKAEIVIAIHGAGRQFVYEVVDVKNRKVILRSETNDAVYVGDAAAQLTAAVAFAVEQADTPPKLDSEGMPIADPTPPPTPIPSRTPAAPHPNAPILVPTPSPSPSPSPTPAASPIPSPIASPTAIPSP